MDSLGGFALGSEMLSPNCIIVIDSATVAACNNCHYELQAAFCDQISNCRKFKLNSSHCVVEYVRGQGLTCKPLAAYMAASVHQVIYISQHLSYELRHMINVSGSMSNTLCSSQHSVYLVFLMVFVPRNFI